MYLWRNSSVRAVCAFSLYISLGVFAMLFPVGAYSALAEDVPQDAAPAPAEVSAEPAPTVAVPIEQNVVGEALQGGEASSAVSEEQVSTDIVAQDESGTSTVETETASGGGGDSAASSAEDAAPSVETSTTTESISPSETPTILGLEEEVPATTTSPEPLYTPEELAAAPHFALNEMPVFTFSYEKPEVKSDSLLDVVVDFFVDTSEKVGEAVNMVVDTVADTVQDVVDVVVEIAQPIVEPLFSMSMVIPDESSDVPVQEDAVESIQMPQEENADTVPSNIETQKSDTAIHAEELVSTTEQKDVQSISEESNGLDKALEHDVASTTSAEVVNATTTVADGATSSVVADTVYIDGVSVTYTIEGVDEMTFRIMTAGAMLDPGVHHMKFITKREEEFLVFEKIFVIGGTVEKTQVLEDGKALYFVRTTEGLLEVWLKEYGEATNFAKLADDTTALLGSPFEYVDGKIMWVSVEGGAFVGFDTSSRMQFSQTRENNRDTSLRFESDIYDASLEGSNILFERTLDDAQ